jgi:hypothetical protein
METTANDMSKPFVVTSILLLILGILFFYSGYDQFPAVQAAADIKLGGKIYLENCAGCHGQKGDRKGPEANRLKTKPRDFTTGNTNFAPRHQALCHSTKISLGRFRAA